MYKTSCSVQCFQNESNDVLSKVGKGFCFHNRAFCFYAFPHVKTLTCKTGLVLTQVMYKMQNGLRRLLQANPHITGLYADYHVEQFY